MLELRLYIAQRASAAIMAPLVLLHLGVIIYAIHGGLDAAEILARTRGSLFWGGELRPVRIGGIGSRGHRPA